MDMKYINKIGAIVGLLAGLLTIYSFFKNKNRGNSEQELI